MFKSSTILSILKDRGWMTTRILAEREIAAETPGIQKCVTSVEFKRTHIIIALTFSLSLSLDEQKQQFLQRLQEVLQADLVFLTWEVKDPITIIQVAFGVPLSDDIKKLSPIVLIKNLEKVLGKWQELPSSIALVLTLYERREVAFPIEHLVDFCVEPLRTK